MAHFEEAVAIERQLGEAWGQADVLNDLAQHARNIGELERAQVLEEEAHELWVQSGSRMGQRAALLNLSVITFERDDMRRARELVVQTLRWCQEIADASAALPMRRLLGDPQRRRARVSGAAGGRRQCAAVG
jgi:hypothetical protein